ncbi:Sodium channel protein [Caligus rogercresseyi]|uniref:Sodium channel protein n=1 Tax=Caligus rogercresseyi TaxID=217165 RepID=A0A7T8GY17_CALRO|nr:Sodium channel protein [Caligus rogercresseyi]
MKGFLGGGGGGGAIVWDIPYLVILPGKHLNSHDCKNEPKYEADQEDVEYAGNCLYQGVHNDL